MPSRFAPVSEEMPSTRLLWPTPRCPLDLLADVLLHVLCPPVHHLHALAMPEEGLPSDIADCGLAAL
eukprot:10725639-Prorocentrum_lima.AAC.1